MADVTKETNAGLGHNEPLDPDAERGLEAARDYEIGIAKERAGFEQAKIGRDQAIGAAVRYGQALIDGRARRKLSNNAFSDWVKASGLDRVSPFDQRQERAAAQQIAEIALKHVASTVDGRTTVNPFDGCPHSRPTNIMRWWRAKQPKPAPAPEAVRGAPQPKPAAHAKAAPRVQDAADRAKVQTLQKEVWRLRDKLDQLAMFLVEKPPLKAEDRPVKEFRYWLLPETIERRPKNVPPKDIVDPITDDPAFALRKEEFEQFLVRRREALEHKFQAREDELKKAFDAKVWDKVEAQMAREDRPGRIGEFRRLATKLATYFHTDKRKRMTDQDWDRAFSEFMSLRNLIIPPKSKSKGKAPPVTPDPAPEPPQEESPSAGTLS